MIVFDIAIPIIANMIVDYEEVTLITGIKSNEQCGICQVPSYSLQDILEQFPLRTHQQMADQMEKQREQGIRQADKNWVHQMSCFAWGHDLVNIHETIAVDMLHQLQKGVFRDLVTLVGRLVNDLVPGDKTLRGKKKAKPLI